MDQIYHQPYLEMLSDDLQNDGETAIWLKSLYLNIKIAKLSEWMDK